MPRTGYIRKRVLPPDPIYGSQVVTRLIHRVMQDGKKTIAEKQVYSAFELIQEKHKKDPLKTFQQALENIKPAMEVRPRRVGGAAYQVPMPVRGDRKESLGIRWLVSAARSRSNKEFHHFWEKLAAEILAAAEKTGGAVQKKEEIQRVADANKAFAHFKW
jgi:small subunit ribosomal protein S7